MGKIGTLFLGMIIGAVLTYGAQRYHVVRSNEGTFLVPKMSSTFSECYVDIRNFTIADWNNHKSLAAALVLHKKEHLLKDTSAESFRDGIRSALERIASEVPAAVSR